MHLRWLAWSCPVSRWWVFLTLVSVANIVVWFVLYDRLQDGSIASSGTDLKLMLLLCAAYVFGCAFRSFLPRADVQRICLFDHWLSSVFIGRSVATVAEICFAVQWAIILVALGRLAGADTTINLAWLVVPIIVIAEIFSWYAVLTRNFLFNAIENSLWAVAFGLVGLALMRLVPEFTGPVRWVLLIAIAGIVGFLVFLATVDVPMYLSRWRSSHPGESPLLGLTEGLRDVRTRWVVTHDITAWREEIAWMSLYFSAAVWSSLALCAFYAADAHIMQYRVGNGTRTDALLEMPVRDVADVTSGSSLPIRTACTSRSLAYGRPCA